MALRSGHHVPFRLGEPEAFKATMGVIHNGAIIRVDAREAVFSRHPLAHAA